MNVNDEFVMVRRDGNECPLTFGLWNCVQVTAFGVIGEAYVPAADATLKLHLPLTQYVFDITKKHKVEIHEIKKGS